MPTAWKKGSRFMQGLRFAFAAAALAAMSVPAGAVVVGFGGSTAGTDPLGHTWVAANAPAPAWGIPGLGSGTLTFNLGALAPGDGKTFATEFRFVVLTGPTIKFTPAPTTAGYEETTRFVIDKGSGPKLWKVIVDSPQQVTFRAKSFTDRIEVGNDFFVNVVFTAPIDANRFAFGAAWDNTVVPEPATWAMLIAGFGLVGFALRRRKTLVRTSA